MTIDVVVTDKQGKPVKNLQGDSAGDPDQPQGRPAYLIGGGRRFSLRKLPSRSDLDGAHYKSIVANGLKFQQEISIPAKRETFLRIAVQDLPTSRVGVLEIPVAMMAKLKPLANVPPPPKSDRPARYIAAVKRAEGDSRSHLLLQCYCISPTEA